MACVKFIPVNIWLTLLEGCRMLKCVFLFYFFMVYSLNLKANERLFVSQLPLACENYVHAGSHKHQACFPGAIANAQKGTASGHRNFSIRQFYALNWPTKINSRGQPDYEASFGVYSKQSKPVWQSWKTSDDIKYLNLDINQTWESKNTRMLQNCNVKGDSAWPLMLNINTTPAGFEIFDRNKLGVYYQTYFNQPAYIAIIKKLKLEGKLFGISLPSGEKVSATEQVRGSIIIKAAWKLVEPYEYDYYHVDEAFIEREDGSCKKAFVGLVGLHIISKISENETNPWSWSTFEHVLNAPTEKQVMDNNSSVNWTFFDKDSFQLNNCTHNGIFDLTAPNCKVNEPHLEKNNSTLQIVKETISNHVTDREVAEDNRAAIEKLDKMRAKSTWRNYRLIDTQWLDKQNQAHPKLLSNAVLEPFIQKTSCIECHNKASNTDFIFLLKTINNTKESK